MAHGTRHPMTRTILDELRGLSGLTTALRQISDEDLQTLLQVFEPEQLGSEASSSQGILQFLTTVYWLCREEAAGRQREVVELERLYFLR